MIIDHLIYVKSMIGTLGDIEINKKVKFLPAPNTPRILVKPPLLPHTQTHIGHEEPHLIRCSLTFQFSGIPILM